MDFIESVVESFHENDGKFDSKKNIQKLLGEIKRYQDKVKTYIDTNYVDFLVYGGSNDIFLDEGDKLIQEVDDIIQNTAMESKSELYASTEELRLYVEELEEIQVGLRTSYKILKIDNIFESLESAKSNNEYLIVMDLVGKLKTFIEDPNDKILPRLECFANIKIKYYMETEMLRHNLNVMFEKLVQFNDKQFQNTKSITMKISKDKDQLHDTIMALFNARYNPKKICTFLMDLCFEPIILKPVSMKFKDSDSEYYEFNLSYSLKDLGENLRPNYKTIFKNIETLFSCLSHMNTQITENTSVFSKISEVIKEQFLKMIINDCLEYSIPETMDEMENSTLVDDILQFHELLVKHEFLNKETDQELPKYSEKIGLIFQSRLCTNIFKNSVEIMRKDLHEMSLVSENNNAEAVASNPFLFPKCMVSRSTLELINLLEKVLKQSRASEEGISERLKKTIPYILNKYMIEVPSHHEKLLTDIPQQTALFHNNCMFLAHWLVKNCDNGIEVFQVLVKSLQTLGSDHFLNQIKNQRMQLNQILKGFDLSNAISQIDQEPKRVVRQCLRQLELLKNVWQSILPEVVYNKTLNTLVNDLCSEIIKKILAIEDIAAVVGNELVEIIGIILERAPNLFQDKHQIIKVKYWMKLTQLKMILGSSLIQIAEQWSEGKGPLTMNYKAEEIKHLIRALFQNTDRRANVLATII